MVKPEGLGKLKKFNDVSKPKKLLKESYLRKCADPKLIVAKLNPNDSFRYFFTL
jgi:hypothetical protein